MNPQKTNQRPRQRPKKKRRAQPQIDGGATAPGGITGWLQPDAGPLPDDVLGDVFSRLDPEMPLLLFPVRIETRYTLTLDPPELRIRIYPDQIHIDADRPAASNVEPWRTEAFWTQWYAAKDEVGRMAAWQRFVQNVGSKRAGYLARMFRPALNKDGTLTFPAPDIPSGKPAPAHPVLLPDKWLAIGYAGGEQIFRKAGRPVARNLRTGPDPEAPSWEVEGGGVNVDEGLAWMIDYERAVKAGMAITIPLTGAAAQATDKIDILFVLGMVGDLDPQAGSDELARLLEVHSRTTGLAFIPQGTPTNNTESVAAGWTTMEEDVEALSESALRVPPEGPGKDQDDNAGRLATALGLSNVGMLRRLANGTDLEATRSRHMRTVLFEAVMGTLIRQLLKVGDEDAIHANKINAARNWFINHVTGGAPVPTLRIGSQPYGILPVRRTVTTPNPTTTAGQVERIIGLLIDTWRESSYFLPTLDSNQGDVAGEGAMETAIATILATQPHPARLFIRRLSEYIDIVRNPLAVQNFYTTGMLVMEAAAGTDAYNQGITEAGGYYQDLLSDLYPGGLAAVDDQIDLWNQVADKLRNQTMGDTLAKGLDFVDSMLTLLEPYRLRQNPLRWLGLERYAGVLGMDEINTTLIAGTLSGSSDEWVETGLVQDPDASPGSTAAEYLTALRRSLETPSATGTSKTPSPKPLLYQLIDKTLELVPDLPLAKEKMVEALDGLAAVDPDSLEWLLRETLGLGAHRLDAWATSIASERLDRLRIARPTGIQIGAFGWVAQLEPGKTRRPSEGFIHAPSMAHAATAALLRAGWHAHGTDDPLSPVAVNLTSERVRTASWLLDGVRQGQPLGDLLGYRFERSLHDLGADEQIRSVRGLVLAAQGRPSVPPDQPVDGIALLELYRGAKLETASKPVQRALKDLEAAFDAVQDVGLCEAVHQLAAGNYDHATAMMDSISTGSIAPPELRSPLTPRSAVAVEHRVVILLRPDGAPTNRGWKQGIRDLVAPALEGWFASLLPPADEVGFRATEILSDELAGPGIALTLAQLELSAMDAVYLLGDDPAAVPAAFATLAAGAAGTEGAVQVDPGSSDSAVSLADFTVLAIELRRLVESLRPLDARDLRPASARGDADTDPSAALDAIEGLLRDVDRLAEDLDDTIRSGNLSEMAKIVIRCAELGISNGASPRDAAGATALQSILQHRTANVFANTVDSADRQSGLEARLGALLGRRVPVLGQFKVAGAADGAIVDVTTGPAGALEVDDWLDAVSRVRADVGKLTTVGMFSELLRAGGLALSVGQDPEGTGEGWAATRRPAGPGRLSVVAASGPNGPPEAGHLACGLLVDHWSEPIPADKQVTGATFQFDAPSNRPPQAWLLAVTPDGEPWSLKLVTDTLLQTLEWATLRAVAPEDLIDYGRAIPTTFTPGNIVAWPKETAS
jgi:hypothetical protein